MCCTNENNRLAKTNLFLCKEINFILNNEISFFITLKKNINRNNNFVKLSYNQNIIQFGIKYIQGRNFHRKFSFALQ